MVTLIFNTGMLYFTVFTIGLQFIFKNLVVVVIVEVYCIEETSALGSLMRRIPLKLDVRSSCPVCNMFEPRDPDL